MKTCSKCGVEKDLSEFNSDKGKRDGKCVFCKSCRRAYRSAKSSHISSYNQGYSQTYRATNRDKLNTDKREYYSDHKSDIKNSLTYLVSKWWVSINHRTVNGYKPRWSCVRCLRYLKKGVRLEMTREEFAEFVLANWQKIVELRAAGEIPSIDRRDSTKNYSINNLRIISLRENARLGSIKGAKTTRQKAALVKSTVKN